MSNKQYSEKDINKEITNILNISKTLKLNTNINSSTWITTNEQIQNVLDNLKLESLTYIENMNIVYSNKLNKKCNINNIQFLNNTFQPIYKQQMMNTMVMDVTNDITFNNQEMTKQTIDLNTNFKIKCSH